MNSKVNIIIYKRILVLYDVIKTISTYAELPNILQQIRVGL